MILNLLPIYSQTISLETFFCFLKPFSVFSIFPFLFFFERWFVSVTVALISFYFAFIFYISKKKNNNFITNYSEFAPKEEQYNMYLLFFGIAIPLVEIILELFHIRTKSQLILKSVFGIVLLSLYFINTKTDLLKKSFKSIFIFIYLSFFIFNLYNIIYVQFELIVYIGLIMRIKG